MAAHEKAPITPAVVPITFINPRAAGGMCNSVLAYNTAVPDTVAMASERRNQAARKRTISFRRRASLTVRQREDQA